MARTLSTPSARSRGAVALPSRIEPMLAVAGDLPVDPQHWAFEYKWDGVRCMAYWDGRALKLLSRNQIVITQRYPELAPLGRALGKKPIILDGEIIALDKAGKPSFPELQLRMHVDAPTPALVRQTPVWYVIFDMLHLGDASLMPRQYVQRREELEKRVKRGEHWHLSPSHFGDGEAILENARRNALEGVVAKGLTSPYVPGKRSPDWRKTKVIFGQEFVVGGWLPEVGERANRVGALLLGYFENRDGARVLRYAGRVGTGFTDATHAMLVAKLARLKLSTSPFVEKVPKKQALFVKPVLVAEIEYRRWPEGGLVQQAAFKGLREDKSPLAVIKELQPGAKI